MARRGRLLMAGTGRRLPLGDGIQPAIFGRRRTLPDGTRPTSEMCVARPGVWSGDFEVGRSPKKNWDFGGLRNEHYNAGASAMS